MKKILRALYVLIFIAGTAVGQVSVKKTTDTIGLTEVVITGYTVQPKISITGAQSAIKGEEIENMPNANFATSLQGKVPGLLVLSNTGRPGDPPFLRLRGTNSLTAGNLPLTLIDGVDAPNLNLVNIADVDNITLLKDPAAIAIYGSRGANGVLLITTKKGKAGESKLTYGFQYGNKKRNSDNFELMNVAEKLQYEFDAGYENPQLGKLISADIAQGNYPLGASIFTVSETDRAAYWNTLKAIEHNWEDDFFRNGELQNHQLSLSGASDKMTYYFNLNRYAEDGIMTGSAFKRTGGRLNADYQAKTWLKVGTYLSGSYTDANIIRESYSILSPFVAQYFVNAYEPLRLPDGRYNPTNQGINTLQSLFDSPAFVNRAYVNGTAFAEITPVNDLLIKSSLGMNYVRAGSETFYVPGSPVDRLLFGAGSTGYKDDNGNESFFYIWSNTAAYTRKLDENNQLTGLAGFEYLQNKGTTFQFNSSGYSSTDPDYNTQNNAAKPLSVYSARNAWTQVSYFGKLSYGFKQKYFAEASIRADGSSRFGLDRRFGTFWSAGLAWNMMQEDFLADALGKGLDLLKLRASVGKTGNNQIDDFDAQGIFAFGKYNGESTIAESRLGNTGLSWENNFSWNVGLDFAALHNRLRGSVDYYDKKSTDLLYKVTKSGTTGFPDRLENAAELSNRGIELGLDGDLIKNGVWNWSLNFNFSHHKNRLERLYGDINELPKTYTLLKVGMPVNSFYLTRWAGVDSETGIEQYYDKVGNKFSDVTMVGAYQVALEGKSANPKYFGTFGTAVSYKNVSLSAAMYYNYGNYVFNMVWRHLTNQGNNPGIAQAAEALNYWKNKGDEVRYVKPVNGQAQPIATDKYLQKGDYIRLRDIMLTYTLPKTWTERLKMQKMHMFLQGSNLFTYAPGYKGDPEVGRGNNERPGDINEPGVQSMFPYTPSKAFTFGVAVTF